MKPLAPSDRAIRVFISSTFRDMQAERDELVKRVFPRLRKLCEQRGVTWSEVDLRWGITDEQKAEGRVLPICLAEIAGCRPYFLGLLGERYGWVIDEVPPGLVEREAWLADARGRSVTELEILHGVLNDPHQAGHCFFYFRDPAALDRLPRGARRADFEAESPEHHDKVLALKDRIRASGLPVHENFQDAADLGRLVLADMTAVIDRLFPAGEVTNPLDRQAAQHAAFARGRAQVYVGREEDYRRLDAFANADKGPPLVLLGEAGTGKSALLANWALRRQEACPGEIVLTHFVGAGEASTDWVQLLRRIMGELGRQCNLPREVPQRPSEVVRAFGDWLRRTGGRRVVLVIDALNQLEDRDRAHDLGWLPETFPDQVRVIVSTLPGRCLDEVRRRGWSTYQLQPLHTGEREQLAVAYLHQFAKSLTGEQLERVVYAPQTTNPLFLRTLLDELRVFGSFERLEGQLAYYLQASSPEELFDRVLARCEADCERERPGLVRDALRLVWAARRGLAEAELLELLGKPGQPLPRVYWSNLALTIDAALVSRSGLLDFSHDYFRRAVERRYLRSERQKRAAHRRLADYFERGEYGRRVTRRRWGGPYWLWLALFVPLVGGLACGTHEVIRGLLLPPGELAPFLGMSFPLLGLLLAFAAVLPLLGIWGAARAVSAVRWCLRQLRFGAWRPAAGHAKMEADANTRAREVLPWQLARAAEWWRLYDLLARPDFLRQAGDRSLLEVADFWKQTEAGTANGLARWWARTRELKRIHRDIFGGRPVDAYRPALDGVGDAGHAAAIAAVLLECGYSRESLVLSDRLVASRGRGADLTLLADSMLHQADGLVRQGFSIAALAVLRNLEGLLRGAVHPGLLGRCLYAQATILQARNESEAALERLDEADRLNPAPANDIERLRARAVRASCLAAGGKVAKGLQLLRETELALLDGGGGPGDVLAVLSRQYRLLAAAKRPADAADAAQRICRLCAELGNADPTPYLDPPPPHRRLAELQAAVTKWRQQGNRKFLTFALAEVARALAIDSGFPVAALPFLTEAEQLAGRLHDRAFNQELEELHRVVHEGEARQRPEMVELARPRRWPAILGALVFGGLPTLFLWMTLQALLGGFAGTSGMVVVSLLVGLPAWLCLAAVLRRLHGLVKPPSFQTASPGLLVRGWGLEGTSQGVDLFRFLRPYRRIEVRPILWEALVGLREKGSQKRFLFRPCCLLQLQAEDVVIGRQFHGRPKAFRETVEQAANQVGKHIAATGEAQPARPPLLPDLGSLVFALIFAIMMVSWVIQATAGGWLAFGATGAFFLMLAYSFVGLLMAVLGLLALFGFGRKQGTLRKGLAALGLFVGFSLTVPTFNVVWLRYEKRQWSRAELDQIVARYPEESRAWSRRGEARLKAGDKVGAIADLTEALRLQPNSVDALKSLGIALVGTGQPARAVADYTAAIHRKPLDAELFNYRGVAHLALGDRHAALADFSAAVLRNRKLALAWLNRGCVRLQRGETDLALEDLDQAVRLAPQDRAALVNRGVAWRLKKDLGKAIADYTAALRLDPNDAATYNLRGAASPAVKGNQRAALADYDRSLQLDPTKRQVYENRGESRLALKDYPGAAADFGQCIRLAPNDPKAYFEQGVCLACERKYKEAAADYDEAIRRGKHDALTYNDRGVALLRIGDRSGAITAFTEAIRHDARYALAFLNRGYARAGQGQLEAALSDFDQCLHLQPTNRDGRRERGAVLVRLGRWQPAAADYAALLETDPGKPDEEFILACLRLKLGDQAGYRALCTELLHRQGARADDPAAAVHVAHVASLAGEATRQPGAVAALARKGMVGHPEKPERLRWYGAALYRAGEYQEAIVQLEAAVAAQKKTDGEAIDCLFLAMANQQAGNRPEAKRWFEKATRRIEASRSSTRRPGTALEWAAQFQTELLRNEAAALLSKEVGLTWPKGTYGINRCNAAEPA